MKSANACAVAASVAFCPVDLAPCARRNALVWSMTRLVTSRRSGVATLCVCAACGATTAAARITIEYRREGMVLPCERISCLARIDLVGAAAATGLEGQGAHAVASVRLGGIERGVRLVDHPVERRQ